MTLFYNLPLELFWHDCGNQSHRSQKRKQEKESYKEGPNKGSKIKIKQVILLSGVVKGRFYDKNGKETVYYKELLHRINQCEEDKKASKEQDSKYPPCNISWNPNDGSKVWCTRTR